MRLKNIKRYRQIIKVLFKYGFEDILDQSGLDKYLEGGLKLFSKKKTSEIKRLSRPERIRQALEELGPTFVKLGQMLSIRPEILPPDYLKEMQKLQDQVPPFPEQEAQDILEDEFDRPVEDVFSKFQKEPHAAASLAQVHRATLKSGEEVIVKIQRPNIRSKINSDLDILKNLAQVVSKRISRELIYEPSEIIDEFQSWIKKELDFVQEARNIDRFKNHFQDNPGVRIPQVYWDFCSSKVVTMEYIDGIGIADVEKIEKAGLDRKEIARKGAEITLKQIFEYGFFHGDPHPGNLFVLEDNVIAPMDFGLVGNLDRELRNSLAQLMSGFVHKNIDRIVRVLYNMGVINSKLDEGALKLDISELIERYYQLEIRHVNVNQIMEDVTRLVTKYKIKLPKNLFLMTKAMSLMESIARQLDPKFNMVKVSKPYVQSFMIKRWSPKNIAEEVSLCIEDVLDLVETSPRTIKRILQQIKRGRLGFNLHHEELSRFIHMLDKASNRISFSLIIAALIIASSVLVNFGKGPLLFGIPAIGLIGYLIAAIMGLWLVIAILRSGRL